MIHRKFFAAFTRMTTLFSLALAAGCGNAEPDEPSQEPESWNGKTYLLDIAAQDWYQPRSIGREIDAFVPSFLLRVDGDVPEAFPVTLGTADAAGVQDPCNATTVVDATATPPAVLIGPSDYSLLIRNDEVSVRGAVYDLTIENVLPTGKQISDSGEFAATMDFRELYPLFTLLVEPSPEQVCTLFEENYAAPCEACPNDGEPWCVTVKANYLGATPTEPIEPVDSVDDPACEPTAEP